MDIERKNILNASLNYLLHSISLDISALKLLYNYDSNTRESLIYENSINNLIEIKEEIEKTYKKYIGEN